MKKSTRIVSTALAAMMVASTSAAVSVSVSAATVKKPAGVKAVNKKNGIKISWKKVKGAKKYQVFRGKKKITTTKKKTYTDKKAKAGKTYNYTVKAVKGKTVSKKSKTVKVVRLTKPSINHAYNDVAGTTIKWAKVKGAKKYVVYRGSKKLATTTAKSYTDKTAKSGTKYTYKIKAVNGKSTSVFSAKETVTYIAAPTVKYAINGDKVVLTWDKVAGATQYQVYSQRATETSANKHDFITETTFTFDLGANPTGYQFKVYAGTGADASAAKPVDVIYIPEGCYFTDKDGNLHVKLALKKGEQYKEGQINTKMLDLNKAVTGKDYYTISVDNEEVATVKDGVITGVGAGNAVITVNLLDNGTITDVYTGVAGAIGKTFGNKLTTGVIYVEVTVTE